MSVKHRSIDVIVLYRLLKVIYENSNISMTELHKLYIERFKKKVNYTIVKRHIEYATEKGLVEVTGGKPARLTVTKKGIDYLFLISQVAHLLNEDIG
ncbi:MAG: hypothetical protein J7J20_06600 [Desulfurococcales archaeon]|nr:hypothetical protein [Desulfurococcales archaeon]